MDFICRQSELQGTLPIPGSKSHTIRAVAIAALAEGESILTSPLVSADTRSAASGVAALGAKVDIRPGEWRITGRGAQPQPRQDAIDVGNSGTTLNVLMGTAALLPQGRSMTLTGDRQIQARPAGPLLRSLNDLGAQAVALRNNDCAPVRIAGRLAGGRTTVEAKSSQYVTSLLLACPLADGDFEIEVPVLYEKLYVQMTLDWLDSQNIRLKHDRMRHFQIPGGQRFQPFVRRIPADFSTATFFFGVGALPGNDVVCQGLDMNDSQGDKAVVEYLRAMGADIGIDPESGDIRVRGGALQGIEIDMNDTPDALPMMAVVGCFAQGRTVLRNVAQARIKETDRIAVMACELRKMGARIDELEDGLVIHQSDLRGTKVDGHGDHRVVMSLALAGLNCPGLTTVSTAEAAGVTFPEFQALVQGLGGNISSGNLF